MADERKAIERANIERRIDPDEKWIFTFLLHLNFPRAPIIYTLLELPLLFRSNENLLDPDKEIRGEDGLIKKKANHLTLVL